MSDENERWHAANKASEDAYLRREQRRQGEAAQKYFKDNPDRWWSGVPLFIILALFFAIALIGGWMAGNFIERLRDSDQSGQEVGSNAQPAQEAAPKATE